MVEAVIVIVTAVISGLVFFGVGYLVTRRFHAKAAEATDVAARELKKAAKFEAESIVSDAKVNAKDEMLRLRDEFELSTKETRTEILDRESNIKTREDKIDQKVDEFQNRLDDLANRDRKLSEMSDELKQKQQELDELTQRQINQLERVAELNREQAEEKLLKMLDEELAHERGAMIRRSVEELKQNSEREAQKIMIQTMQRYAGECSYEYTTCTVPLPSDEMKGRIIGREGRNIRVFEAETGVNVLIDDTPSAVVISCFEPVRREVARLSLERLVADGRIHPTRVEEVVAKARKDVQTEVVAAGEEALHQLQIGGVPAPVVEVLGRLRYRYSYTQNVLEHSIEVASFMAMIAGDLGLDVALAKRMGLFHDIGKALDHDKEGSHAIIGMEFLKRHGESASVLNGVGCHHDEVPADSPLSVLVSVCDALSASRPGSRSETTQIYLKRLDQLETIGLSFEGVDTCYAVQAGREIRVIVEPDKISENKASKLSRDIAVRIEEEMQYPGQIKICVIRETRSVQYAK